MPTDALPVGTLTIDYGTVVVPTAVPGTGVVTGRVLSAGTGEPLAGLTVYLGTRVPLTPGPEYMITLGVASSPKGIIDNEGRFVVAEVAPGEYPIIVWSMGYSTVVPDATGEREFAVTVVAGQLVDLGDLVVAWR